MIPQNEEKSDLHSEKMNNPNEHKNIDKITFDDFLLDSESLETSVTLLILESIGLHQEEFHQSYHSKFAFKDIHQIKRTIKDHFKSNETAELPSTLKPYKSFFQTDKLFSSRFQKLGEKFLEESYEPIVKELIEFMRQLSKMRLRHVRLVSVTAIYSLVKGMVKARKATKRNIKIAKSSKRGKNKDSNDLSKLSRLKKKIDNCLHLTFDKVFVHRYRDVCEVIREHSVRFLGEWIEQCSSVFLEDQKLRYIGWLLNDKNDSVRKESLKTLSRLYRHKKHHSKLTAFSLRFFPRIIEMLGDRSHSVTRCAVQLITLFYKKDLLARTDDDSMVSLLWHKSPKIREDVANFLMLQTFNSDLLQEEDLKTIKKLLELCERGKKVEKDTERRVFTLVGSFFEKIPLLKNWSALFELLHPFLGENNPQIERTNGIKKRKLNSDCSESNSSCLEEKDLETFCQMLKAAAIFEKDCKQVKSNKINEENGHKSIREMSLEILQIYPDLLLAFKTEEKILISLLGLAEHLDYQKVKQSDQKERLDHLKDAIASLFAFSSSSEVSESLIKTLCELRRKEKEQNSGNYFKGLVTEIAKDLNDSISLSESPELSEITTEKENALMKISALTKFSQRKKSFVSTENTLKCGTILTKMIKETNDSRKENDSFHKFDCAIKAFVEMKYWSLFWSLKCTKNKEKDDQNSDCNDFPENDAENKSEKEEMLQLWMELFHLDDVEMKSMILKQYSDIRFLTTDFGNDKSFRNLLDEFSSSKLVELSEGSPVEDSLLYSSAKLAIFDSISFCTTADSLFKVLNCVTPKTRMIAKIALCELRNHSPNSFIHFLLRNLKDRSVERGRLISLVEKKDREILRRWCEESDEEAKKLVLEELYEHFGQIKL